MEQFEKGRWARFALGLGVPRDGAEAEKWFHRAAEGSPTVAAMIGRFYEPVVPPPPSYLEKAIYWYERAAEGGFAHSLLRLG